MLFILYVRLTIKVKVGKPESFKVGWYRQKITGSSHLKDLPKLRHDKISNSDGGNTSIKLIAGLTLWQRAYLFRPNK